MKKLETRKEILDYLKQEQDKVLVQMKENLEERQHGDHTMSESAKLMKEFDLLLERNKAFKDISFKILGIGE